MVRKNFINIGKLLCIMSGLMLCISMERVCCQDIKELGDTIRYMRFDRKFVPGGYTLGLGKSDSGFVFKASTDNLNEVFVIDTNLGITDLIPCNIEKNDGGFVTFVPYYIVQNDTMYGCFYSNMTRYLIALNLQTNQHEERALDSVLTYSYHFEHLIDSVMIFSYQPNISPYEEALLAMNVHTGEVYYKGKTKHYGIFYGEHHIFEIDDQNVLHKKDVLTFSDVETIQLSHKYAYDVFGNDKLLVYLNGSNIAYSGGLPCINYKLQLVNMSTNTDSTISLSTTPYGLTDEDVVRSSKFLQTGTDTMFVVYSGSANNDGSGALYISGFTKSGDVIDTKQILYSKIETQKDDELFAAYYIGRSFYIILGSTILRYSPEGITVNGQDTSSLHTYSENILDVAYPNPAREIVRVVSSDEIVAVEICNMQGREIYNNKVKGKSAEIDVRGFDKGIYFVTIHTTKGTKTEKVIVE